MVSRPTHISDMAVIYPFLLGFPALFGWQVVCVHFSEWEAVYVTDDFPIHLPIR